MDKSELACVYAALILVDDDIAITVSSFFNLFNACAILFY